ncbi:pyridoxamine 5'-phosphate oxidase family protein [Geodermatophilus sp. DF01-2]|uniref:pyridoxamine 5'-phosphate oxidase family protein n=1 Tax=Geodermatophilus sp. DF01-2 TaxID=2559610 RepID=UPI0010730952|nr:pyridoxamine 5'-phosphate oxidase family protein [Geodermatophilus sp. DF01_2]TFV54341.1 pyridoxamine 5'-phosphate oxidase family protein [Geodermatophilus sp. DF01_2]
MDAAPPLSPTARSTVRRGARRARTDRAELHAVLDAGLVGHLGLVVNGSPIVLPTGYGRRGDILYLHGSTGAASLRAAAAGVPVCFTVTLLDGVVYARSAFHHSMNYRCAVVHGVVRPVTDPDERLLGLEVLTEHLAPGSWAATRQPDRRELAATALLALDLTEASVKVRTGPPGDDDRDVPGPDEPDPVWAGVLPVRTVVGEPEPCPLLPRGTPVPTRVRDRVS